MRERLEPKVRASIVTSPGFVKAEATYSLLKATVSFKALAISSAISWAVAGLAVVLNSSRPGSSLAIKVKGPSSSDVIVN